MPVIDRRMPAGVPGDVSRRANSILEPNLTAAALTYGSAVQLDDDGHIVAATDSVYGFLVRPYPTQAVNPEDNGFGPAQAPAGTIQDVMVSGYMTVKMSGTESAVPVRGTPVTLDNGAIAVSGAVDVPGCIFMGPADADGNVEIAYNI